uniref:Uncharacterized protein n=1 Tax=Dendroctonus ponderosae TaxID=77166 RepID=A0AAR5Q262_DENPD
MPFPQNVECALEVEEAVRSQNAVPATIALVNGAVKVGLCKREIEILGDTKISRPVKTSRRDFPYVLSNKLNGGTTVAGTLVVCNQVGLLFGVPVPEPYAFDPESINRIIDDALVEAHKAGISGKNITPFLLEQIAGMSGGSSLKTNIALIKNNAKTAAEIAVCLAQLERNEEDTKPEEKLPSSKRPVIIGGCNLDCVVHLESDELKLPNSSQVSP